MKLSFINFHKQKLPKINSLRPVIFESYRYWFLILFLTLFLLAISFFISFRLYRVVYTENYKQERKETINDLIDVQKLKTLVEKRLDVLDEESFTIKETVTQNPVE